MDDGVDKQSTYESDLGTVSFEKMMTSGVEVPVVTEETLIGTFLDGLR